MMFLELYQTQWYVRKRSETVEGVAEKAFKKAIPPTRRRRFYAIEQAYKRIRQIKTALKAYNLVAPTIEDKQAIEQLEAELERQYIVIERNLK